MAEEETSLNRLSHYRIISKLRSTEMGDVYLGQDERLGRPVAVKILPASFQYDTERRSRLLREAGAAAGLKSPSVVLIYDVGDQDGTLFIVMEYVEGDGLHSRLREGPLPVSQAVEIVIQTAEALHEAHSLGLIHGDIRASNLILAKNGLVKVLDFGLSRIAGSEPGEADKEVTGKLGQETVADFMSGTVSYLSPEQAVGKSIDSRTDLFSVGIVLFEMITGRVPFEGRTATETVDRIVHDEAPPIASLRSDVPGELARIVSRCLEKDPERRYQSALELAVDLKNLKRAVGWEEKAATPKRRAPRHRIASLAVLPLVNAGSDPNAEYLSDGITENIINNLSRLPNLRVAARSTVFTYKNSEIDPLRVARELDVAALLTGRVLLRGESITVSTELVDAADGSRIWGGQYQRELSDILAIEEALSEEITENLRLKLTGKDKKRLKMRQTDNPAAYREYLRGRYHWNRRTEDGFRKGIHHFELAIAEDPLYALAYAGLADCYSMLCSYCLAAPAEVLPKARAAASKALEIDDTLAEAHASLAAISEMNWEWSAARKLYQRAIELNRNYATGHQWYSEYLARVGELDEALKQAQKAQQLDPLSSVINTGLGWILFFSGRIEEAIAQYRAAIELEPAFAPVRWRLGEAYAHKGLFDEAIAELRGAVHLSDRSSTALARLGRALAMAGQSDEAAAILDELKQRSIRQYVSPYDVAIVYAGLGDRSGVIEWLERAYEGRASWLSFIGIEPIFDDVRSDSRFADLLRRIGLIHG